MSNLYGIKLPAKTFRRAAKTEITAPTFIRTMWASHVMHGTVPETEMQRGGRESYSAVAGKGVLVSHSGYSESCSSADTHSSPV